MAGVLALTAAAASAQTIQPLARPNGHLTLDINRLLPPDPPAVVAHRSDRKVEPLLPLEPILDRLPLQAIQELLRTEQRLGLTVDKYRVRPRLGFHEIGIVVTRPLE